MTIRFDVNDVELKSSSNYTIYVSITSVSIIKEQSWIKLKIKNLYYSLFRLYQ